MKRYIVTLLFIAGTLLGCAQNHFNIPAANYAEKVKVLGVAPILMDADSDIIHPQKELLIPLIAELNKKYEPLLLRKLQSTGNYYAVTPLTDQPGQLFSTLLARREKRDDANVQYNKYFWKSDEVGTYIKRNRVDAIMIVVISGLTKSSKIFSSNLLTSLETNFNFLTLTAQIIGPDGTVLWEYPNFRGRLLPYYPLVNLQYPDFSESEANLSRKTEVRFKSIDGIRRILEQKRSDWLLRESPEPEIYGRLFDEITSLVKHNADKKVNSTPSNAGQLTTNDTAAKQPGAVSEKKPSDKSGLSNTSSPTSVKMPPANNPSAPTGATVIAPSEIVPASEVR